MPHILLFFALICLVSAQPAFLTQKEVQCYNKDCPSGTTGCKKVIETSDDKKTLQTIISCLDSEDMVLKDYREDKENPFGPSTTFHSSSFSGTYTSHSSGPINLNINNDVNKEHSLEDLSRK